MYTEMTPHTSQASCCELSRHLFKVLLVLVLHAHSPPLPLSPPLLGDEPPLDDDVVVPLDLEEVVVGGGALGTREGPLVHPAQAPPVLGLLVRPWAV